MTWGLSDVTAAYGDETAVQGVTMEAMAGAITAVVGADGAGKTTVLRLLAGAHEPVSGEVRRPARERLGFMSAHSGVYPDLTVTENLAFAAAAYRAPDERAGLLLEATGLDAARGRLGGHLSGGMRQKLGVAMALVHEPDLVALDEPTTGLDPVSRAEVWMLLAEAAAGGAAVVVSTAYLEEGDRAAHVLVLDEGRPLLTGSPDDIVRSVPGTILECDPRPQQLASWRHGRTWRAWSRDGRPPAGSRVVTPSLEDAVIVAALGRSAA